MRRYVTSGDVALSSYLGCVNFMFGALSIISVFAKRALEVLRACGFLRN
jgi:hypothetical protein